MAKKKSKEQIRFNRLKFILAEKKITQTKLSEMVEVDRNTITRICNNKNQPSMQLLYKIAITLDIDVCDFFTPVSEMKKILSKKGKV